MYIGPNNDCDDYAGIFWGQIKRHIGGVAVADVCGSPEWTGYQSHAFNLVAAGKEDGSIGVFAIDTTAYMSEDIVEVVNGNPVCNLWAMRY